MLRSDGAFQNTRVQLHTLTIYENVALNIISINHGMHAPSTDANSLKTNRESAQPSGESETPNVFAEKELDMTHRKRNHLTAKIQKTQSEENQLSVTKRKTELNTLWTRSWTITKKREDNSHCALVWIWVYGRRSAPNKTPSLAICHEIVEGYQARTPSRINAWQRISVLNLLACDKSWTGRTTSSGLTRTMKR